MLSKVELDRLIANCQAQKNDWNSLYWAAFAYTQPERNYIWRTKGANVGNLKQVPLYTQSGKIGTSIFVARIQNKLSPYNKPYFNFRPKASDDDNSYEEMRNFASLISAKVNELKDELKLDDILNDAYYDLCAGTACIFKETTLNGLRFRKIPVTDFALGTEKNQTVTRTFKIPAYKIGIIYPELKNRDMIGGNSTRDENRYNEITLKDVLFYDERAQIWEYYVVCGDEKLLYRKYKTSPYYLFHWERPDDMPFGCGVAVKALPALKRLNGYIKAKLELIPFAFPMFFTQAGNLFDQNVNFKPGGMINVKNIQNIMPVKMNTEANTFQLEISLEEQEIKQTFLDSTLPTVPTDMTAAEVRARVLPYDEAVNVGIGKLTNIIRKIGWDLFEEVYNRELRGNIEITLEDMKSMLDCEINNENSTDDLLIQKITGYINTVAIDPSAVWQSLDRSKTLEQLSKAFNLPAEIRRTSTEIDEVVDEQNQAQAEMNQEVVNQQMAIDSNKANANAIAKEEAKNV